MAVLRADRQGAHRVAFDKNKKRLLKTQNWTDVNKVDTKIDTI